MPEKPKRNIEDLIRDRETHPNRGKINGQFVCSVSTTELQVQLPEALFEKIQQRRGALGMGKGQFAQEALLAGVKFFQQFNTTNIELNFDCPQEKSYRGNVPTELYSKFLAIAEGYSLNKHQAMYLAFTVLLEDVELEYQAFLDSKEQLGIPREQVEELLKEPEDTDLCEFGSVELNIQLPGEIYNRIIQCRGALGMRKDQIAQSSVIQTIKTLSSLSKVEGMELYFNVDGRSNFRGNVSIPLYRRLFALGNNCGISSKHAIGYLAFSLFCYSDFVGQYYQDFIEFRALELGCKQKDVISAIYGYSKRISRDEAIRLLENNNPQAFEPKMNI